MPSILITGASSGFGRDTAIALANRGWRVCAAMREPGKSWLGPEQGTACGKAGDIEAGHIVGIALDVTRPDSITAAVDSALTLCGGTIDVLLNNAGYSVLGAFEDLSDADCRAQMETNFFGVLGMTRAVLPAMRAARSGRILVVSSNAVNAPHPLLSLYAASKWALEGWAEGLAMEIAPFGIELALLQPGAHRTEFARNVQFIDGAAGPYARWLQSSAPGIAKLDAWGRDPALGVAEIVAAVTAEKVPFRQQLGPDSQLFAALKGKAPYEVRALLVRAICGLPAAGAFTGKPPASVQHPVLDQIVAAALADAAGDPALSATIATLCGLAEAPR